MVERDIRRRTDDDEHARAVEPERGSDRLIGLEAGEVVLLLQPRVAAELGLVDAVAPQPLGRDRLRHDHPRRGAAAELVLEPGPLVVERGRAGNAEPAGRDRQLVRPVRQRQVEVPALGPAAQMTQARGQRASLAQTRAPAVTADQLGFEPVQLEQLQGLRVVARRQLDLGALLLQQAHQRPVDEHMRRRGHVDPDSHRFCPHRFTWTRLRAAVTLPPPPVVPSAAARARAPRDLRTRA